MMLLALLIFAFLFNPCTVAGEYGDKDRSSSQDEIDSSAESDNAERMKNPALRVVDLVTEKDTSPDGTSQQKCVSLFEELKTCEIDTTIEEYSIDKEPAEEGIYQTINPFAFPHAAYVGFKLEGELMWMCGGSLISHSFILTAGHCTRLWDGRRLSHAKLGSKDNVTGIVLEVERTHIPPNYKYPDEFYNDIALVQLKRSVVYTAAIRPACLHWEPDIKQPAGIALAWIDPEDQGYDARCTPQTGVLSEAELPFVPLKECSSFYPAEGKLHRGLDDSMVCARTQMAHRQCLGSSGFALQVKHAPLCMFRIVGVSTLHVRGLKSAPNVYIRVSHFIPWIESVVWP